MSASPEQGLDYEVLTNLEKSESDENLQVEEDTLENSTELSLRLINSMQSFNSREIDQYELINSYKIEDELKCLIVFIKALPHNPITQIYPENPFLFFKGVPVPTAFNLQENDVSDIENFLKGQYSELVKEIRLHDLEPYYLDAYETAVQIYNEMIEKARNTYISNVKAAKSQVIEISAALVCGLVIVFSLIGIS